MPVFAGFGDKSPIRWGKVSPAEFSVKPLGSDSAAPAVVLCDFGDIDISNRTFYTRHTRIKIMNEAGLRYATVEIPYQKRYRHDDFYKLKARTLVMDGGRVSTYNVPAGQIEDIRINDHWSKKKFTFPQARPGAIIELEYVMASLDFEKLDTWYFQREIPTLWSEVRIQIPSPFVYLVTFENNRPLSPDEELAYGERLQWLYNTRSRSRRMQLAQENELLYATGESRLKVWAMSNLKKKIIMKNLPGLSGSFGDQPVTDLYPRVRFDLFESSGNLPRSFKPLILTTRDDYDTKGEWLLMHDRTAIPGYIHFRLKTWPQYNDNLLEHERFGKYLLRRPAGTAIMDSITAGSRDNLEKMAAVYRFVRNTFRWNGEFTMYTGDDFDAFMRKREGSSAEINLLLINMLRNAGIKTDPLLVRTNDLGIAEKMYPVKNQFNHVIAIAEVDGARVLLDATSGSGDLNRLNLKDIGTRAWIVSRDNPGWIEIFSQDNKGTRDEGQGTRDEGQGTSKKGQKTRDKEEGTGWYKL